MVHVRSPVQMASGGDMSEMDTNLATTQALVVVVEMLIEPRHYEDFMVLMRRNAAASLDGEDGCLIFDVCTPETAQDPPTVLLYERYVSAEAFELHLRTEHFKVFDEGSRHMIRAKSVRRYRLQTKVICPASSPDFPP